MDGFARRWWALFWFLLLGGVVALGQESGERAANAQRPPESASSKQTAAPDSLTVVEVRVQGTENLDAPH
ncbi:MAG: hypothetical protein KatS3mg115_0336 [Candidatus Poribacteria bacterium]|nr:MAG: hypothetical protein KatS3mg115_0336 [Candidatus Poribacteria bacterium]